MGTAMIVHGRHGGIAEIMDDGYAGQTREEQIANQKRMVEVWSDMYCKYRTLELAQRRNGTPEKTEEPE